MAAPFLGLLLTELAVRAFDLGPRPRVEPEDPDATVVMPAPSSELGFRPRPNSQRRLRIHPPGGAGEAWVVERVNRHGFRGPAVSSAKPPGVFRIACLGDSHTYGFAVGDGATWPAQLEARLRERLPGRAIEVLNAGVNGYDTVQEVQWLKEGVLGFEPDLVLLAYFANDAVVPNAELDAEVRRDWLLELCHPLRDNWLATLRRYSRTAEALAESTYRRRRFAQVGARLHSQIAPDFPGWHRSRQALLTAEERLAELGIEFGVVLFPLLVAEPAAEHGRLASSDPFRIVAQFLEARGIPHFDAEPCLGDRDPEALRVSEGDMHAGPEAYALVGAGVADWLAENRQALGI